MGGFEQALTLAEELLDALTGSMGRDITRWFLAALFTVAGVAKLRRPMLAAMAMVDFGIVRRPRQHLGLALGATELFVALLVALPWSSPAGLFFAAALLWIFVAMTARALLTRRDVACFCLGDPDSHISTWSGLRTGALAVLVSLQLLKPEARLSESATDQVMYAVAACSLFSAGLLLARVPRLLRWNAGTVRIVEEETA